MTASAENAWEQGFVERLEAALPIADMLGWLVSEYPAASERDVLAMVQKICILDYEMTPAADHERTYKIGDGTWDACPQRVSLKRPTTE